MQVISVIPVNPAACTVVRARQVKRPTLRALFLLLIASLTSATAALAAPEATESLIKARPLKVGFILPLSGSAASYGIASQNGFEMARAEGCADAVQAVYEDDQYNAAKSVSAFKKLSEINKVDMLVSLASTPSNAVAPLAARAGIPLFSWANDPKVSRGRKFVVLSAQSTEIEGREIVREIKVRGYKSLALVVSTGDYQLSVRQGVLDALSGSIPVVANLEAAADDKDFRSILTKIRAAKPAAIGMCFHPGQFGIFAKQAREMKLDVPLFGCDTMEDPGEIAVSGGALRGAWYDTVAVEPDFEKQYLAKFGNNSVITGAATHYEVGKITCMLAKSGLSREEFVPYLLKSGQRQGALGSFEVKSENDIQYFSIPVVIKKIE